MNCFLPLLVEAPTPFVIIRALSWVKLRPLSLSSPLVINPLLTHSSEVTLGLVFHSIN